LQILLSSAKLRHRYLAVPPGVDDGTQIPITIVHGTGNGPVLALIAGTHGYEYPGITALQRVRKSLDPGEVSGTIIMVHVANLPSFLGRTIYNSPVDGKNLNRMYPGDPDGSVSQRIAHLVTSEVIDKADYLIDLHAGDGNEALRPFVYMPVTGDKAPIRISFQKRMNHVPGQTCSDHLFICRLRVRQHSMKLRKVSQWHLAWITS
jgi:predicted deacylase